MGLCVCIYVRVYMSLCLCVCNPWNHRDPFGFAQLFSIAGGTWSRDRAGANEDTYLLLVISTGDVLSTYLQMFPFSAWREAKPRTSKS